MVTPWPHDGIAPLEVWDALADVRTLFALRDEPAFFEHLVAVALALRRGEAVREGGARLPLCRWGSIALVGGRVDEVAARSAFGAVGAPIDLLSTDPFLAASAAVKRLGARGAVIDVGQTALKAVGPAGQVHQPRQSVTDGAPRLMLIEAIARTLVGTLGGVVPSGVLFALPCEVEAREGALWLGASSYPTEGEGAPLLEACLAQAGVAGVPAWVVNDAVLAAWATVEACGRGPGRLVFTIGHGVGGAWVEGG